MAGVRARISAAVTFAVLRKLTPRERAAVLARLEYRTPEINAVLQIEEEAQKMVKTLTGRKTASADDGLCLPGKRPPTCWCT